MRIEDKASVSGFFCDERAFDGRHRLSLRPTLGS